MNRKSSIKPRGAYLISGLEKGGLGGLFQIINCEKIHIYFSNFTITQLTKTEREMVMYHLTEMGGGGGGLITKSDFQRGGLLGGGGLLERGGGGLNRAFTVFVIQPFPVSFYFWSYVSRENIVSAEVRH